MRLAGKASIFIITAVFLAGCARQTGKTDITEEKQVINAVETNVYNSNKQNNTKTYTLKDDSEEFISQIIIDESDNTFMFSYDVMSSYLAYGQYTESEGQLELKTDDGKYHYIFDIIDENTLKFKQENSSRIKRITGKGIGDGAEFVTGTLSGNITNTDGLEILRKLYIDFPQDASYQEAISFVQESGLPYSERKLNGSRYIKIALEKHDTFIETPVVDTFKNYDYIKASYMYPKKENSNNDELDKYFFAGIIYVSAGGYQLESHDNSTFITNKDGEIADSKMDRQEQMYFLESHTEPAIE